MILTEEEAKTKICPTMSSVVGDGQGKDGCPLVGCLASECMNWAWHKNWLWWRTPTGSCGLMPRIK